MSIASTVNAFFASPTQDFKRIALQGAQLVVDGTDYVLDDQGIFIGFDLVISRQEIDAHAARIDLLNMGVGTHRQALTNPDWRLFYNAQQRNFDHVDAHNPNGVAKSRDSAPCNSCGICLPLPLLQIDHVHPQEGTAINPILKVLRALGLTMGGPKGSLGIAVHQNHGNNGVNVTGGVGAAKFAKGPLHSVLRPPRNIAGSLTRFNRYSTSEQGNAFLSLFWKAPGGMLALEQASRNSVVNLRPLCATCNLTKSNMPRVMAW